MQQLALGAPLLAGTVKVGYDITLWAWARRLPLGTAHQAQRTVAAAPAEPLSPHAQPGEGP